MAFTYYLLRYVLHYLKIAPFPRERIARCFFAKQSTNTRSRQLPPSFTRNVFARKRGIARRKRRRWRERNAVGWFRRTWKEVGRRENPWEWSCEGRGGGGGGGCTSGEHRGREEASCKEYKQCVLIRAPWPDECTIVTLQGFATPPRPTLAAAPQRSRALYIRCPAPRWN